MGKNKAAETALGKRKIYIGSSSNINQKNKKTSAQSSQPPSQPLASSGPPSQPLASSQPLSQNCNPRYFSILFLLFNLLFLHELLWYFCMNFFCCFCLGYLLF
ncbi:hypothetical protein ACOSQ3_028978 [Xanthoceras sorbifolium]